MKKFFSFGSKKGGSSCRVTSSLRDRLGIRPEKRIGTSSFWGGYNIRDKDLRKIHKVASMGDVRKLQEILFFGKHGVNERDKMNRTALHLACANGHPDVVAVLVERKCQLDLFDKDYRTALMKAVQSQNERCVTILLEHGADPNLTDIAGNTALHYAAVGSNTSIAEKLLLHHANTEVRNKDELTPLLLAVSENKPQMVEFLIEKEANVHAVDKLQSSRQLIAEHREEKLNNYLQSKNAVADKSSEEESLSSISIKPGTDDSWPTSDDEDFNFDIKTVPKPNLRALMNASEQFKNVGTKCDLTTPGGRTLSEHDNSDYGDENIVGLLYKPPFKANDFSCPAFSKPSVKSLAGHGVIKEGEVQPATGKEDNGINITQSAPQEQTVKDNLTSAYRAYKSNSSVTMSALGLGEEEDGESPWDSESISESVPKKDIKHLFGAADPKGPRILNEQVEDSPKRYPYVKRTVEVKDSVPNKTVEVKEKQTSKSVFSCWKSSVGLCHSNEPCQRSRDLRVDDKGPSVSQSVTKSQSASTEFGRTTFIEKEKINNIGVVFLLENDKLHDLCKSELPESREHKPDLPAELDLERTSEEEQKRLDESENNHLQTVPKPNLRALMNASEQFKNVGTQCDLTTPGGRTLSEHDNSDYGDENIVGLLYKPPFKANDFSCPAFSKPSVKSLAGHGVIKEGEVQPATGKEDNGINITQSAPQEQTVKDNLTSAYRAYKSNSSVTMSALGLGEEEDGESPWDSESISESVPKKDIKHLFGAADPKGPRILNEQVEDSPKRYPYVKRTVEVKDSVPNKTVEVKEKQTSKSVFSCWKSSVGLCHSNEPCQRSRDLRVDDKGPSVSQSVTKSQSASTEFGRTTFIEKEKINNIGVVFLLENDKLHDLCKSELPESREHKPDLPAELDLERTSEEEQKRLDESENNHLQINEEKKRHQSNGTAVLENVYAVAAGLTQQRESGKTENHLFPVGKKEDSDGPAKKTSHEKKEVKKQINFMDDLDLTESSGTASEDSKLPCSNYMSCKSLIVQVGKDCKDSSTLRKIQDAILPYKKSVELKKNQCKQLKRKNKEMEDKVNGLQKELSETKELKLQLEHQKMKWEQELSGLRFTFKEEEEKRRNADKLYEKMREQFREKAAQYNKEVEMKQQLELTLARTVRNNVDQVAVRHLQLELADALKIQSMSEASLEVISRCRINLEDETQDLRKKLGQIRSQLQEAQDRHAEAVRCIETLKDHVQKLEVENAKLKVTVKKQAGKIEQLQENLLSTSLSNDEKGQIKKYIELKQCLECSLDQEMKKNGELEKEITRFKKLLNVTRRKLSEYEDGELTFPGNSKTNQIEMESQINMLKQKVDDLTAKLETASSKCLYLDANNQLLTQELTSMKEMQKKYEKLEKDKKKLEQQVVNLRSQVEFSMVEYSKTEQYKWELEERTRLDITEKLKEANLFFETQLASQESLGQIRETNNTLIRNHMEIRIKDLELELSRMKSFQDFYEKEFEKYKHLYLEELKVRVSLENELNKTNEKLAETSTKLLVEKQQKKFLINPITMSPVLELPSVRNMNNSSLFNRYVAPRESLVIPTSSSWPTKNGIETFLTKMQQEMERNITRELEADAAEFESDSWCMTSSLEPTYESHANDDLLVKSSKEYLRILKKKYMI
ncbi:ankyrin repeat domain-containing protein 26-like isoform X11 [Halichoerus grypus]